MNYFTALATKLEASAHPSIFLRYYLSLSPWSFSLNGTKRHLQGNPGQEGPWRESWNVPADSKKFMARLEHPILRRKDPV